MELTQTMGSIRSMIEVTRADLAYEMKGNNPSFVIDTLLKMDVYDFIWEYVEVCGNNVKYDKQNEKFYVNVL